MIVLILVAVYANFTTIMVAFDHLNILLRFMSNVDMFGIIYSSLNKDIYLSKVYPLIKIFKNDAKNRKLIT